MHYRTLMLIAILVSFQNLVLAQSASRLLPAIQSTCIAADNGSYTLGQRVNCIYTVLEQDLGSDTSMLDSRVRPELADLRVAATALESSSDPHQQVWATAIKQVVHPSFLPNLNQGVPTLDQLRIFTNQMIR
jgi:hypothetical protein